MADDPYEFAPGYVSPLTDKEHATIGRIALLWGQIEHFVEEMLPAITNMSRNELAALQVTSKTIASKVDFLTAASKRIKKDTVRQELLAFCSIIHETKTQRNHVFHGIWGWRGDDRTKRVFPAARKESDPEAPFPASSLCRLEKKLCKCSRMGFDFLAQYVYGQEVRPGPSRFIHHGVQGDTPTWLLQWSERNPWDCGSQDCIEPDGQLPRRARLYPQK